MFNNRSLNWSTLWMQASVVYQGLQRDQHSDWRGTQRRTRREGEGRNCSQWLSSWCKEHHNHWKKSSIAKQLLCRLATEHEWVALRVVVKASPAEHEWDCLDEAWERPTDRKVQVRAKTSCQAQGWGQKKAEVRAFLRETKVEEVQKLRLPSWSATVEVHQRVFVCILILSLEERVSCLECHPS